MTVAKNTSRITEHKSDNVELRSSPFKPALSVVEGGEVRRGMGSLGDVLTPSPPRLSP